MTAAKARLASMRLPPWAADLVQQYESGAANQFLLSGNVADRLILPIGDTGEIGSLDDFLTRVLLPRFDVILSYDLANGLRVDKGGDRFAQWPRFKEAPSMPRMPIESVEYAGAFFRYVANLAKLGQQPAQVALVLRNADLVAPPSPGGADYPLSALASQIRSWASEAALVERGIASFLVTPNLSDLHPLIGANPRVARARVPLPQADDVAGAIKLLAPRYPTALRDHVADPSRAATRLAGATLSSIESMLKAREYLGEPLADADLSAVKKALVEQETGGLIEFIEPTRTLDDIHGQEALKTALRQDIALWRADDLQALPMGYLLCGPVGTGKTFLVECLAGEAGVPVVKLKNFRDKWVGSTEGNLEKIFRLVHALGRCMVFVDEADQALGKRDGGANDGGVGGRVYAMLAEEMSDTKNRGKIVWILASSRPDLIEVDLKRPGRVDVKIPLFPTTTPEEGFRLIRALCKRRGLDLADGDLDALRPLIPDLLTPGAAEAIAVKAYRLSRVEQKPAVEALRACLTGYQSPVSKAIMDFQIGLAVTEASDVAFVPARLRPPAR